VGAGGVRVKICGLTRPEDVDAAATAGAAYLGFVFFDGSPRNLSLTAARDLAALAPPGVAKVALNVDPGDAELDALTATVPIDMLQLHGRESPQRVAEIRVRTRLPVIKAVGLRTKADLSSLEAYEAAADMLLVDAKPPQDADRPGGLGAAFDWSLITGRRWRLPWLLAGGLTPESVARAIHRTGAVQVDVSSGVESAPGRKDPALIRAFIAAADVA